MLILSTPTGSLKWCVWCLKKRWHAVFSLFNHNIGKYICFIRSVTVRKLRTNIPLSGLLDFWTRTAVALIWQRRATHRPWWRRLTCSRQHNNGGCRGRSSSGRLVRQFVNGLSIKETYFFSIVKQSCVLRHPTEFRRILTKAEFGYLICCADDGC